MWVSGLFCFLLVGLACAATLEEAQVSSDLNPVQDGKTVESGVETNNDQARDKRGLFLLKKALLGGYAAGYGYGYPVHRRVVHVYPSYGHGYHGGYYGGGLGFYGGIGGYYGGHGGYYGGLGGYYGGLGGYGGYHGGYHAPIYGGYGHGGWW